MRFLQLCMIFMLSIPHLGVAEEDSPKAKEKRKKRSKSRLVQWEQSLTKLAESPSLRTLQAVFSHTQKANTANELLPRSKALGIDFNSLFLTCFDEHNQESQFAEVCQDWITMLDKTNETDHGNQLLQSFVDHTFSQAEQAELRAASEHSLTAASHPELTAKLDRFSYLAERLLRRPTTAFPALDILIPLLLKSEKISVSKWKRTWMQHSSLESSWVKTSPLQSDIATFNPGYIGNNTYVIDLLTTYARKRSKSRSRRPKFAEEDKRFGVLYMQALLEPEDMERAVQLLELLTKNEEALGTLAVGRQTMLCGLFIHQLGEQLKNLDQLEGLSAQGKAYGNSLLAQQQKAVEERIHAFLARDSITTAKELEASAVSVILDSLSLNDQTSLKLIDHTITMMAKIPSMEEQTPEDRLNWIVTRLTRSDDISPLVISTLQDLAVEHNSIAYMEQADHLTRDLFRQYVNEFRSANSRTDRRTLDSRSALHALEKLSLYLPSTKHLASVAFLSNEFRVGRSVDAELESWLSKHERQSLFASHAKQLIEVVGADKAYLPAATVGIFKEALQNDSLSPLSRIYWFYAMRSNLSSRVRGWEQLAVTACRLLPDDSEQIVSNEKFGLDLVESFSIAPEEGEWASTATRLLKQATLTPDTKTSTSTNETVLRQNLAAARIQFRLNRPEDALAILNFDALRGYPPAYLVALANNRPNWCYKNSKYLMETTDLEKGIGPTVFLTKATRAKADTLIKQAPDLNTRVLFEHLFAAWPIRTVNTDNFPVAFLPQDQRIEQAANALVKHQKDLSLRLKENCFNIYVDHPPLHEQLTPIILEICKSTLPNLFSQDSNLQKRASDYFELLFASCINTGRYKEAVELLERLAIKPDKNQKNIHRELTTAVLAQLSSAFKNPTTTATATDWWNLQKQINRIHSFSPETAKNNFWSTTTVSTTLAIICAGASKEELDEFTKSEVGKALFSRPSRIRTTKFCQAYVRALGLHAESEHSQLADALTTCISFMASPMFKGANKESLATGLGGMLSLPAFQVNQDTWRIHAAEALWLQQKVGDAKLLAKPLLDSENPLIQQRATMLVKVGRVAKSHSTLNAHEAGVRQLAQYHEGLLSLDSLGIVRAWDLTTRTSKVLTGGNGRQIEAIGASPDGKTWAFSSAGAIHVGAMNSRPGETPLAVHRRKVWSLTFSPDGRTLASSGADNRILLADINSKKIIAHFDTERGIRSLCFSKDGQLLVGGGLGRKVYVWDLQSRKLRHSMEGHTYGIRSVAISDDNQQIVSGADDMTVLTHSLAPRQSKTPALIGHSSLVTGVAILDTERAVSCGMDGKLCYWNLDSGQLEQEEQINVEGFNTLVYDPSTKKILLAGRDRVIYIVEVE